jgi:cytochrome c
MRTLLLAGIMALASASLAAAQDAAGGQQSFMRWCLPCHDAGDGAKIKLGPPLNGLNGRKAGTWEGYNYSDPMKDSGITWNEAVFKEYVTNPLQKVPGTRMAFTGVKDEKERNDLWAFLNQFDKDGKKK